MGVLGVGTCDKIVDAAMAVVRDRGVGRLTLEEAARVAGISKGGVLYHFKSKDDLVSAMVARLIDQCDSLQAQYYESLPPRPNRWAKACLLAALDPQGPATDPIGGALLAAVATNPDLVKPLEAKQAEWMARLRSDSPHPALALLVCLAMDGLWLRDLVGLGCLEKDERERLKRCAIELLDGEGGAR